MRLISTILFLLIGGLIQAQEFYSLSSTPEETMLPPKWFIEAAGGVAVSSSPYQYDTYSDYLSDELDFTLLPYLSLRVGARLQERHLLAFGWERMHLENGFRYQRDHPNFAGIGLGATNDTPYEVFGVYYEYNLLKSERFRLAPMVQLGIGWTDPTPHLWDSTSYQRLYQSPMGTSTFHRFEMVQQQEAEFIFVYGAGLSAGVELLDDRLFLGLEFKFMHAPAPRAKVYEVTYQVDQEAPLIFNTYNEAFTFNLGLRLRYEF